MTPLTTATVGRNERCPCNSGRRYKDCCGRLVAAPAALTANATALMQAALSAQQARRLDEAAELYRKALSFDPEQPDALHMLGVICYERGDDVEAATLIRRALDLTQWRFPAFRHNYGLVLARAFRDRDDTRLEAARRRHRDLVASRVAIRDAVRPRVAVVVPCFNHARYLESTLESVYAQTYRDLEIIVIDDGSRDASPQIAQRVLARSPFPSRFVARANRGAAHTINEGIALSSAPYVNLLNSDDAFAADRIERMVEAVVGRSEWGFGGVGLLDAEGGPVDRLRDRRAFELSCLVAAVPFKETVGFALLTDNVAVSSGNLFFSRSLHERIGGFRDFRYNHDWDFALRALRISEPVFDAQPSYLYRLHEANTIAQSASAPRAETDSMMPEFLHWAIRAEDPESDVAPCIANWGAHFVVAILQTGMAEAVDVELLRELADRLQPSRASVVLQP